MSFSGDVKLELVSQIGSARHCRIAELAGILSFTGRTRTDEETGRRSLLFQTENEYVEAKLQMLLKKTFGLSSQAMNGQNGGQSEAKGYVLTVAEEQDEVHRILQALKCSEALERPEYVFAEESSELADSRLIQADCCKRALIRGAFLAAGSISNPEKSYHFEIVCHNLSQAQQMQSLINGYGMDAKIISRKKYEVVYVKESEQIADLLKLMGAYLKLLDLENLRIMKGMRNSINRQVNCETANINKTVNAAQDQIEAIEYIRDTMGLSWLPENLEDMARVRLEYDETPLKELGEKLCPPVGKSGVNHRLRKIMTLAEDLKKERGEI